MVIVNWFKSVLGIVNLEHRVSSLELEISDLSTVRNAKRTLHARLDSSFLKNQKRYFSTGKDTELGIDDEEPSSSEPTPKAGKRRQSRSLNRYYADKRRNKNNFEPRDKETVRPTVPVPFADGPLAGRKNTLMNILPPATPNPKEYIFTKPIILDLDQILDLLDAYSKHIYLLANDYQVYEKTMPSLEDLLRAFVTLVAVRFLKVGNISSIKSYSSLYSTAIPGFLYSILSLIGVSDFPTQNIKAVPIFIAPYFYESKKYGISLQESEFIMHPDELSKVLANLEHLSKGALLNVLGLPRDEFSSFPQGILTAISPNSDTILGMDPSTQTMVVEISCLLVNPISTQCILFNVNSKFFKEGREESELKAALHFLKTFSSNPGIAIVLDCSDKEVKKKFHASISSENLSDFLECIEDNEFYLEIHNKYYHFDVLIVEQEGSGATYACVQFRIVGELNGKNYPYSHEYYWFDPKFDNQEIPTGITSALDYSPYLKINRSPVPPIRTVVANKRNVATKMSLYISDFTTTN